MVDKKTIGLSVLLALIVSGGINAPAYFKDDTDLIGSFYCESRDLIMQCEGISGGKHTRCYYDDTYKVCNEGWTEIIDDIPEETPKIQGSYKQYKCDFKECIEI